MSAKKIAPLRRCVGCMEMKDKRMLIRIIRSSDGEYKIDWTGKAAGRGAYICKSAECLRRAQKNKGFQRSFKHVIPEDIYAGLQGVITQDAE